MKRTSAGLRMASLALAVVAAIGTGGPAAAGTLKTAAVSEGDQLPLANFGFTTNNLTANFTDYSTDGVGTITTHDWTFGDGGTSTVANPSHTYASFATYSVTETVIDNVGAMGSRTASVSIVQNGGRDPQVLLANTGFESTGSWKASTGVICEPDCSGETAHTGQGMAWLDGYGSPHTDTLSQQTPVILPGKVTLQFYLHVDTTETSATKAYDKLTVALYNKSGALLKTLATYSNLNKGAGYVLHSFDVSQYAGQAVTLKFTGTEDASLQTSFVLDDVTMVSYAN